MKRAPRAKKVAARPRTKPVAPASGIEPAADARAKKILFDTYWASKGWIDDHARKTDAADFAYAKAKGLMFDPLNAARHARREAAGFQG